MLPIGDVNPTRHTPYLTLALIALNAAAFLFWQPTFAGSEERQQVFFYCNAEVPFEVSHQTSLAEGGAGARAAIEDEFGPGSGAPIQQLLTERCPGKSWLASVFASMFLHAGWAHIGFNMLFLWVFGNNVEDRLRPIAFAIFYLLGGIAATALQVAFDPGSAVPNIGASGAVAAVLGAYLVMFPRARVRTLSLFFIVTVLELPALVFLGLWFVLQLFSGVGELGSNVNAGVAYWAHIGGFLAGVAGGLLFRSRHGEGGWAPPRPDLF